MTCFVAVNVVKPKVANPDDPDLQNILSPHWVITDHLDIADLSLRCEARIGSLAVVGQGKVAKSTTCSSQLLNAMPDINQKDILS
jgi:hypothetical protein